MKLLLRFDPKITNEPIIASTVKKTGVLINILRASVEQKGGEMLVEVPEESVELVVKTFKDFGVEVSKLEKPIIRDEELCIHCGACISLCPTNVFRFNESQEVIIEERLCLHCGICVKACPVKALRLL
ncbi:MAG: [Fe-S]-binding protein [Candidatus Hydrothermarchaeota archaeon]|nr:MAG: [Fe-S]-binding protein [Candidatus Hydrothermarchaeota archaeon]RLG60013.1 MAG: [Fe-S]-binding protein [Candidatus Hydrothermarchaeota archaeon]